VLWQTRRLPEAADALRAAIAARPAFAQAHYVLGTILRQQGDATAALAEFRTTIEYEPQSPEAFLSIGQILQRQKDAAGAAKAFAEADRLNKLKADQQAALFAIGAGRERLRKDDLAGALAQFQEAVRLDPANAQAHFELGSALERSGNAVAARTHLDEARRLGARVATDKP
jgi:tetratricopeptide (TPR) repeat protein